MFFLIISSFSYPKITSYFKSKYKNHIHNLEITRLLKTNNCNVKIIDEVPFNSTVIIGHLYGSPANHNNFIDQKAQKFLIDNKLKIKNLFLTGDVFHTPSLEKWVKLFDLLERDMNLIIAPGNHDIGSLSSQEIFNKSIKHNISYPIVFKEANNLFVFENSIESGWHIKENTFQKINKLDKNKNIFLLRHNIAAKELIRLGNSRALLKNKLHDFKFIDESLERDITIISGDGGAFQKLPRFFCRKIGNVKYIVNGIGGIKGDIVLIISNKEIFKYNIN